MLPVRREVFIDPTPLSSRKMTSDEMQVETGGAIIPVAIITCGGKLGSLTVVTIGTIVVDIID